MGDSGSAPKAPVKAFCLYLQFYMSIHRLLPRFPFSSTFFEHVLLSGMSHWGIRVSAWVGVQ